jgi:hypothetical protein
MNIDIQRVYHWILWNVLSRLFVRAYLFPLYNFRKKNSSDHIPAAPFIVVSNHGTFFDPWIIGSFSYHPFNFMCNDDAFRASPTTVWYLNSIGAFPKKKGAADVRALKETLRRLRRKSAVCIFPEGQTTWDGETQLIHRGIEKIARQADCPIVMMRVQGNFLTKPWWARSIRKGRILVSIKVLSAGQIKGMSDDQAFEAMRSFIQQNDVKDPENLQARFSGARLAEGLERFVWLCMQCGAEDTLAMSGDTITCHACGSSWTMDAYCHLRAVKEGTRCLDDLRDWSAEHRVKVLAALSNPSRASQLTKSDNVAMQTLAADGYTFVDRCKGTLSLSKEMLTFSREAPSVAGENLAVAVHDIRDYVIQKKDILEFRVGDTFYRFVFDHHSPMKWVYYLRYLNGYELLEKQGCLG